MTRPESLLAAAKENKLTPTPDKQQAEREAFNASYNPYEFRHEYDKYGPTEAAWSIWQAAIASHLSDAQEGELTDAEICYVADRLWEQGHISSLSKDTAVIFARAILSMPRATPPAAAEAQAVNPVSLIKEAMTAANLPPEFRGPLLGHFLNGWIAAFDTPTDSAVNAGAVPIYRQEAYARGLATARDTAWSVYKLRKNDEGSLAVHDALMAAVRAANDECEQMRAALATPTDSAVNAGAVPSDALADFLAAQDALDNHELNGQNGTDYFTLVRRRNDARKDLDAALATKADSTETLEVSDVLESIIRDACEAEPCNPDSPDAICIGIDYLHEIVSNNLAALSAPKAQPLTELANWAAERWHASVANRPMINVHRRALDDTWREVLRYAGVDDRARLGPTHDELRAQISSKEWEAMNGIASSTKEGKWNYPDFSGLGLKS